MAPAWAELFARVWAIARLQLHDARKEYRRVRRRWRLRNWPPPRGYVSPQPGAVIPIPSSALDLGYVALNDLLKQSYTRGIGAAEMFYDAERDQHVLKVIPSLFLPPSEEDERVVRQFLGLPCHRGLN